MCEKHRSDVYSRLDKRPRYDEINEADNRVQNFLKYSKEAPLDTFSDLQNYIINYISCMRHRTKFGLREMEKIKLFCRNESVLVQLRKAKDLDSIELIHLLITKIYREGTIKVFKENDIRRFDYFYDAFVFVDCIDIRDDIKCFLISADRPFVEMKSFGSVKKVIERESSHWHQMKYSGFEYSPSFIINFFKYFNVADDLAKAIVNSYPEYTKYYEEYNKTTELDRLISDNNILRHCVNELEEKRRAFELVK